MKRFISFLDRCRGDDPLQNTSFRRPSGKIDWVQDKIDNHILYFMCNVNNLSMS